MKKNIQKLFNKFSGREVPVREVFDVVTDETLLVEPLNRPEPVFEEMQKVAEDNGLTLRVLVQGKKHDGAVQKNRVNAHLEKGSDGTWHIGKKFTLG